MERGRPGPVPDIGPGLGKRKKPRGPDRSLQVWWDIKRWEILPSAQAEKLQYLAVRSVDKGVMDLE